MSTLMRNGVSLAYDDAGAGEPPMVFVHGWTADRRVFAPQVSHFSRTHRTIAPDLRGHGESDKPHDRYSPSLLADDVAWLCDCLGLRNTILVGHSMGGLVVLELAARRPDLAAGLILLDAPVFVPAALMDAMQAVAREFHEPGHGEAARRFVAGVFLDTDDPRRREDLLDRTAGCPQHVLSSAWDEQVAYDASAAAGRCRVPMCYIAAATPLAELSRLRAFCPQLVVGQTVGAGHFHQLEVPDQINSMIERILFTTTGDLSATS